MMSVPADTVANCEEATPAAPQTRAPLTGLHGPWLRTSPRVLRRVLADVQARDGLPVGGS